jgi:hypothetical protein
MILKHIISKVNKQKCLDRLTTFHRQHYYEPGYILDSKKITKLYNVVFEKLHAYEHTTNKYKLDIKLKNNVYELLVENQLLRDWFVEKSQPYSIMYYMDINHPKNLSPMAVLLEVIFELTYYSFPENVENPV